MRNVWMIPVFAVLLMGFGRCPWWPPPGGGGGDDGRCRRDRDCAGAGACVDGTCECSGALVLCAPDTVFNEDPAVCACEPAGGTFCGGIAGIPCPGAGMCVDDPSDDCDPDTGGADCGGICECSAAAVLCITGTWFNDDPDVCECQPICGGFLGLPCPGEGECVDDPNDDCDPANGGADCSGLCECNVGPLIDCVPGDTFDDSPSVCACE